MAHNPHHEHLMKEVAELFEPLLTRSPQAIYIYLDDEHKICNQQFVDMLGYKSIQEWVDNEYPVEDIKESERDRGIESFMSASEGLTASSLPATWINKDGSEIRTTVIMTPFIYQNEIFVIHFINEQVDNS